MATSTVGLNLQKIYEKDFNQWLEITAKFLREKNFNALDLDNLINEIESMGNNNKRELKNRLVVLILHLLKWKYQSEKKSKSWLKTINEQRRELEFLLEDNPSLKREIEIEITKCYEKARKEASRETNLDLKIFPSQNPFNLDAILDDDFFPEN
jgi:hypothetical protein